MSQNYSYSTSAKEVYFGSVSLLVGRFFQNLLHNMAKSGGKLGHMVKEQMIMF